MKPPIAHPRDRRIIIADADARVRQLCRATLEQQGYVVDEAVDAAELLARVADRGHAVILTDASLPGVDDRTFVRSLRPDSDAGNTAVIVLTRLRDASHVMTRLRDGVDDYLVKPVRPQELVARMEALAARDGEGSELNQCRGQLGENARALVLLLEFSLVLAETEELDRLVQEAARVTASLLSCRRVAIMLPGPDPTTLRIAGSVGIDPTTVAELNVPIGEGVAGRVYESGSRLTVDSVRTANPDHDVHDSSLYGTTPALAWAMRSSERTVGVIHLSDRANQRPFSEWELDFLDLFSSCATSAIQSILVRRAREEAREAMTVALASLAEHRDNDTGQHLERMTGFCLILAERLSTDPRCAKTVDSAFIDDLRRAAPLHDIGKVAIPDYILLKPGRLTASEMEIMRTHAAIGAATIRSALSRSPDSRFLAMAEDIAHGHHEWVDGSGYPRSVRGTGIPLSARIAALADVYDALTSPRVYKTAMSHARAKSTILELSDRQFDPLMVEMFLASERAFEGLAADLRDELQGNGPVAGPVDGRVGGQSRSPIAALDPRTDASAPRDHKASA